MMNIYNKKVLVPNQTLIGNWYEEQCLREKTKEGRTIPAKHIPKKAMDFDTVICVDPCQKDNTFDRTIGEKKYKEFSTTNATYGDFSQPENKYKILGMAERMYNDFFNCYVAKEKKAISKIDAEKINLEEQKNNGVNQLEFVSQLLVAKIVNVCSTKGWLGLRQFKNYLLSLSKKHNEYIHKDDVKYFFVNFGICLEEKELDYICTTFQNSRNEIDYISLINACIIVDEKRTSIINNFVKELKGCNGIINKELLVKMFNPQIHPSVNRYEITDYEISKEYRDNLPNNKYYSDTDCIRLFSEISMCVKDENDFVQSMKACGYQE